MNMFAKFDIFLKIIFNSTDIFSNGIIRVHEIRIKAHRNESLIKLRNTKLQDLSFLAMYMQVN